MPKHNEMLSQEKKCFLLSITTSRDNNVGCIVWMTLCRYCLCGIKRPPRNEHRIPSTELCSMLGDDTLIVKKNRFQLLVCKYLIAEENEK